MSKNLRTTWLSTVLTLESKLMICSREVELSLCSRLSGRDIVDRIIADLMRRRQHEFRMKSCHVQKYDLQLKKLKKINKEKDKNILT